MRQKLAGVPVWICIIICIFGNLAITYALYKAKVIKETIHYLKKRSGLYGYEGTSAQTDF